MLLILLVAVTLFLAYFNLTEHHQHWKKNGVRYEQPTMLFGNMLPLVLQRLSATDLMNLWYKNNKYKRYFGCYWFLEPVLVIKDLDLIRRIGIQDFDSFSAHQAHPIIDLDAFLNKNLFVVKGQKWEFLRTTLRASFSNTKMFDLVCKCSENFVEYFKTIDEDVIKIEMNKCFKWFTNDAIASCAFGIECDSFSKPENDLFTVGSNLANFECNQLWKFMLYQLFPNLSEILKLKVTSNSANKVFKKIINDTMKVRTESKVIKDDMLNLLMEAKTGKLDDGRKVIAYTKDKESGRILIKQPLTDEDIAAQALGFFCEGVENTSTLLAFTVYELAVNKSIQDKLRNEIESTLSKCNGKITYQDLISMKYLDMVIMEALRKWPPLTSTDRNCTKDYVIESEVLGETELVLRRGTRIWIPIFAIHRDPDNFPNPDKFDPERFNGKNKMRSNAFMPFGIGPRNCIGSQFGLMKAKTVVFHILQHFEFVPIQETIIPPVFCRKHILFHAENGMHLGLKRLK